jgi:hypothetical protein
MVLLRCLPKLHVLQQKASYVHPHQGLTSWTVHPSLDVSCIMAWAGYIAFFFFDRNVKSWSLYWAGKNNRKIRRLEGLLKVKLKKKQSLTLQSCKSAGAHQHLCSVLLLQRWAYFGPNQTLGPHCNVGHQACKMRWWQLQSLRRHLSVQEYIKNRICMSTCQALWFECRQSLRNSQRPLVVRLSIHCYMQYAC